MTVKYASANLTPTQRRELARNIIHYREKNEMTQAALADKIGRANYCISSIERKKGCSLEVLESVAKVLGSSTTALISGPVNGAGKLPRRKAKTPVFRVSKYSNGNGKQEVNGSRAGWTDIHFDDEVCFGLGESGETAVSVNGVNFLISGPHGATITIKVE